MELLKLALTVVSLNSWVEKNIAPKNQPEPTIAIESSQSLSARESLLLSKIRELEKQVDESLLKAKQNKQ